jgi:hypothetical protein
MGANDQEFIDAVDDHFNTQADTIEDNLPDTASITGNKRNMISAEYDIAPDEYDNFFAAYIGALERGFTDLVIENPKLVTILDDIYTDAVAEVYNTQITLGSQQN